LIRRAIRDDIPHIMDIRAGVRENRLRDPSLVTVADVCWFVENPGLFVWVEDSKIVGFSAADATVVSLRCLWTKPMKGAGSGRPFSNAPLRCSTTQAVGACG